MKITDIFGSNIETIVNQKKVNTQTQNTTNTGTVGKHNANKIQDSVSISDNAKIQLYVSNLETEHQKRLEAVQKAYESGTYKPDLTSLAKSILEEIKNG